MRTIKPKAVLAKTLEALKAAARPLSPGLRAKLRALGVDFAHPLEESYPLAVWGEAMSLVADELFEGGTQASRQRRLGRRVFDAYAEDVPGQRVVEMARVLGPRRALERSAHDLRSGTTYLQLEVHTDAPNRHRLTFAHIGYPDFCAGVVERAVELAGAASVEVVIQRVEGEQADFLVTWA